MKATNVVKTALWIALLTTIPAEAMKFVAVVETEIDAQSDAPAKITKAEVRQLTGELRRQAVNNLLPRDAYTIMTSETVIAQGGAVLEECAEENCVITLGAKIGADYIVRGVVSTFGAKLTLSVEIYETENGNLVASSEPIRSENPSELLEMASTICADMYKTFLNTITQTATAPPPQYEEEQQPEAPPPATASRRTDKPATAPETPRNRRNKTGFSVGFYSAAKDEDGQRRNHTLFQIGAAHSRQITKETVSLNLEGDIWIGGAGYGGETATAPLESSFAFFGIHLPATALFQLGAFSIETGAHGDMLFGDGETVFDAGLTVGIGVGFSKDRSRRYFYRYNSGFNYGTHLLGVRWLF